MGGCTATAILVQVSGKGSMPPRQVNLQGAQGFEAEGAYLLTGARDLLCSGDREFLM
jgi:hypothetical protein